jgi:hypothetical protein
VRRIVELEPERRNKVLLAVLYAAGLRVSEACGPALAQSAGPRRRRADLDSRQPGRADSSRRAGDAGAPVGGDDQPVPARPTGRVQRGISRRLRIRIGCCGQTSQWARPGLAKIAQADPQLLVERGFRVRNVPRDDSAANAVFDGSAASRPNVIIASTSIDFCLRHLRSHYDLSKMITPAKMTCRENTPSCSPQSTRRFLSLRDSCR